MYMLFSFSRLCSFSMSNILVLMRNLLKHTLTLCGWYCKQGNFFPSSLANCFASSWISTDQVVFKERSSETLKFAQRQPYIHLPTTRVKGAKIKWGEYFPCMQYLQTYLRGLWASFEMWLSDVYLCDI